MSVYADKLTPRNTAVMIKKIQQTFPTLPEGFYAVLMDRIKANDFTDQRLKDAVTHVVDNCIYPTPTIAQFVSFDRRMKLYTYNQVLKLNDELLGKAFEFYRSVRIGNNEKPIYAHANDIKEFNLTLWKK